RRMNKNRIEGGADQGERAGNREALVIKGQAAQIRRSCGEGVRSYVGRPRLVGESPERGVSRGRSSRGKPHRLKRTAKDRTRRGVERHVDAQGTASDARASGAGGSSA